MPRRFSNLPYGPIELRPLLRARLQDSERIVGWGHAQSGVSTASAVFAIGLAMLPGVGQLIGAVHSFSQLSKRRVLVLTDRRLLVLRGDRHALKADGKGVLFDLPLASVRVACGDSPAASRTLLQAIAADPDAIREVTRFNIYDRRAAATPMADPPARRAAPLRVALPKTKRTAAERLREALVVLAQDQDQELHAAEPILPIFGRGSLS